MKARYFSRLGMIASATMIAGGAGTLFSVAGCSRSGASDPAVFRIIAVDTSGSAEPDLVKYRRFTFGLVRGLRPGVDAVRVLRFDYEPHEILRQLGHRKETLLGTLSAQLRVPAERPQTRLAKLYQRIAELMEDPEAQGKQIEVYILSDNGNDDASPEMVRLCIDSSAKIALNPRLAKIAYWGIKPRLAEEIPTAFAKLPAGVLSVQFNTEALARR
jgi:hypothetical protein